MPTSGARTTTTLIAIAVVLAVAGEWFLAAVYGEDEVTCQQTSVPAPVPALPEASGVAASRRTPGLLWVINDSPPGLLFGLNDAADVQARVRVTGGAVTDWEDVSVGPCPRGSCVYIADIGDNDEHRDHITVYRFPEPAPGETATRDVEVFEARYPDRPHDAEAMFIMPDGTLYVVTKESPAGTVYRFPPLEAGKTVVLERVTSLPIPHITDADTSADGEWVAVRNGAEVVFYRASQLLAGDVEHGATVNVGEYGEPQGEGVTFADRGAVYLAGEGGNRNTPGTLMQLRCTLPNAS